MKACGCLFLKIVIQVSDGLLARFVKYYFIVIDRERNSEMLYVIWYHLCYLKR